MRRTIGSAALTAALSLALVAIAPAAASATHFQRAHHGSGIHHGTTRGVVLAHHRGHFRRGVFRHRGAFRNRGFHRSFRHGRRGIVLRRHHRAFRHPHARYRWGYRPYYRY